MEKIPSTPSSRVIWHIIETQKQASMIFPYRLMKSSQAYFHCSQMLQRPLTNGL